LTWLGGDLQHECWQAPEPIERGESEGLLWATADGLLMLSLTQPVPREADLAEPTRLAYRRLVQFAWEQGYPALLRLWNYVPHINAGSGDAERYRRFCVGRNIALEEESIAERELCAATAVGTHGERLLVHALAGRIPGIPVENPRQVSAYRYPRIYGPRSPSFARATALERPGGNQALLISGTASIVGHRSLHVGDAGAQLNETVCNLDTLLGEAAQQLDNPGLARFGERSLLRAYLRDRQWGPAVAQRLGEQWPAAHVAILEADICRSDLLVEIEAYHEACPPHHRHNEPIMTSNSHHQSASTAEQPSDGGVAPHPVIREYYADEPSRKQWVNGMFDATAGDYDWINAMMSLGSGRLYRKQALQRLGLDAGMKLLDVGTGTGVIAHAAQQQVGPTGEVVAVDPSEGMLEQARIAGVTHTLPGRAESLPVPADHFDMLTMGYALRHVADLETTFAEYRRVLKPGGKVLLLEITRPRNRVGLAVLKFYLRGVVPLITRIFRRSRKGQTLMRYYWETIEQCVPPETILSALRGAGFEQVNRHVVMGIFSEYTGVKPESASPDARTDDDTNA
ncbi:MAG: class I SAM-dependent methyltransferase, partial [Halofilum sp. (in: g-proteobacteria)]